MIDRASETDPEDEEEFDSPALTYVLPISQSNTILGLPQSVPLLRRRAQRHARKLEGTELAERYEVLNVIGEGGMATVYRGRHKAIQKAVAIKVLDGALDKVPDAVERFLQEAQVTSRVIHEHVVEVTDFGVTSDGIVFCVMELLHGETLAEFVDSVGALPLPRAAAIMQQICSAVQAAHDRGIIHRDLKPENCFRTPRTSNPDFIKLFDFGIARVAHDLEDPVSRRAARPNRTQVGCIVGTPEYMAPEQARAEPFDHRVDVYAAGGVFFELLTGRAPYVGKSAADLLASHLYMPVPDPGDLVPSLSLAVRDIVKTAMAKDPNDRYYTIAAMAEAIEAALDPAPEYVAVPRRLFHHAAAAAAVGAIALGYWALSSAPMADTANGVAVLGAVTQDANGNREAVVPASVVAANEAEADALAASEPTVQREPVIAARSSVPPGPVVWRTMAAPGSAIAPRQPRLAPPAIDPAIEAEAPEALTVSDHAAALRDTDELESPRPRSPASPKKGSRKSVTPSKASTLPSADELAPTEDPEPVSAKISEVKNPFAPTP